VGIAKVRPKNTGGREKTLDWLWWIVAALIIWYLFFRQP
jgi:hypothetical protein